MLVSDPVQTILGYWVSSLNLPFNNLSSRCFFVLFILFQFTVPSISSDSVSVFHTLSTLDVKSFHFYFFLH